MGQVRDRTTAATRDVADTLEPVGLTARRATIGPDMCTDDGAEWRQTARMVLDPPEQQEHGDAEFAAQIRDTFVSNGWQPYESEGSYEAGISQEGEPGEMLWAIRVQRDDVQDVVLYTWDYRPYVEVEVLGECVPANDEQQEAYIAEDRQPIDLAE